MKFKSGDIVYHRRLKQFGTFLKYRLCDLCDDDCLVKFSDANGCEYNRLVSTS